MQRTSRLPAIDRAIIVSKPPTMEGDLSRTETATSGMEPQSDFDSPRVVSSDKLLAGALQLAILHNNTVYFLRQTRFGKLILTK